MNKKGIIIIVIMAVIILAGCVGVFWYGSQLGPVNEKEKKESTIEIESGMSTEKILNLLYKEGLIKNTLVSKVYIKLNGIKGLQAGKYTLNTGMSLDEILTQISSGDVVNENVKITFLEGKNMRWIAKEIADKTNNKEDDVYDLLKDNEYINSLIEKYWFITDEVKNEYIYYPLEGYLCPDTYNFKDKDVTVKEIFKTLLDQQEKVLEKYKDQIKDGGPSIHQVLTMASIIELEGRSDAARKGISSVIYNRLKKNMSLGSDVTTYYAIKVDMSERNLRSEEINTYNPYNTRGPNMAGKLPVGPIASVSENSINAALNPSNTDNLYFVADSNGKVYFSKTYAEHQQTIKDLQKQGIWYEY